MTDAQWESLMVPINMAFFFESSTAAKVIAVYPEPCGSNRIPVAAASKTWGQIVTDNPELESMEADVEALLVNRLWQPAWPHPAFCRLTSASNLVGLVRMNWRGLSGLSRRCGRPWNDFFAGLAARAGFGRGPSRRRSPR